MSIAAKANEEYNVGQKQETAADTGRIYYLKNSHGDVIGQMDETGRFTQEDTYLGDGRNLYAYVHSNPLKYVDPTGHNAAEIFEPDGNREDAWKDIAGGNTVKTYQTYTKVNPTTGQVYSGRTSGYGSASENVRARDLNHHMNAQGYGPAKLDQSSSSAEAIRGREQMLINSNGGAQSTGGTSGNAINGISANNPKGSIYMDAARGEFGILE